MVGQKTEGKQRMDIIKLHEERTANSVLETKIQIQKEAILKLEQDVNKAKAVKRILESKLFEDRIKSKRTKKILNPTLRR